MRIIDTVVVGAGFAGLAMVGALRRAGRDDVIVLERAADVGGTWRDNTYPGVACDVPAHLYSLAAHPNAGWSRTFAPGGEIQDYLRDVADREELGDKLRLRTPMLGAAWDAETSVWHIDTGAEELVARSLVLACGRLTEPFVPSIPGLESFAGPLFHSARWNHDIDLTGKRVAVVGTGASAVQLVPELARLAAHVTLFQRTPAWIVPAVAVTSPSPSANVSPTAPVPSRACGRSSTPRASSVSPRVRATPWHPPPPAMPPSPTCTRRSRIPLCAPRSPPTTPSAASACCSPTRSTRRWRRMP